LFFGLLIIYSGFGLVRQSIAGIMDEADYRLIRSIVNHLQQNRSENWVDIHNLRVIKYGPNLHIDCHLTLPWYLNTQDAHEEVKALESLARNFQNHPVEWFIHVDPCEPTSCYLCAKKDCSERKEPFREQVAWTLENVMNNAPHDLPNRTPMPLQGQNA
ncbi:MAG: cation diffusion facilitator family transporter, partial [Haliscomenobacter sp.]|nr:cation diffusion facilitator family transporter [Haliscomenobacter sp.]